MNRAYYDAEAPSFATADPSAIFGQLAQRLPFDLVQTQSSAWLFQIAHLQTVAAALPAAHIFLEFAIPRMGRRADAGVEAAVDPDDRLSFLRCARGLPPGWSGLVGGRERRRAD